MSPATQKLLIGLICLVPLLIIFNVTLFGMLKKRPQPPGKTGMPHLDIPFRNPWQKEDNQLSELNRQVATLFKPPSRKDSPGEDIEKHEPSQ